MEGGGGGMVDFYEVENYGIRRALDFGLRFYLASIPSPAVDPPLANSFRPLSIAGQQTNDQSSLSNSNYGENRMNSNYGANRTEDRQLLINDAEQSDVPKGLQEIAESTTDIRELVFSARSIVVALTTSSLPSAPLIPPPDSHNLNRLNSNSLNLNRLNPNSQSQSPQSQLGGSSFSSELFLDLRNGRLERKGDGAVSWSAVGVEWCLEWVDGAG